MNSRHLRPLLAILAIAALPPAALADAGGQAGVQAGAEQSGAQQSGAQQPGTQAGAGRHIRLSYMLYGHGFHVLDVVVDLRLTPQAYSVQLNDHTTGFLGMMMHTNVTSTATGRFVPDGVQPIRFTSAGYSRGAQRNTVLDYIDGNPVVRVLTPAEPKRDPVDISRTKGSMDTLSAIADMVHQVQVGSRCDGKALIFDGLRLTDVRSVTIGQQTVPSDGRSSYGGTALRCDFVSQEIGGFLHNEDEAKMRQPQHGTAWVSQILPGAPALPVRIMFENPKLGMATMFLSKVEENPAQPGG